MARNTGAGASVSSGANYQARVAAYTIAASVCDVLPMPICESKVYSISFETSEKIDDLLITTHDEEIYYIQAKANITFSQSKDSEFYSVVRQFVLQEKAKNKCKREVFILATTPRASKKIAYDTRKALDAYRSSPIARFNKDQNLSVINIISDIKDIISKIMMNEFGEIVEHEIDLILKKSCIVVMDIEDGDAFENSTMLLLQMNKFLPSATFWGKIISDSITYASQHRTLFISDIKTNYLKYQNNISIEHKKSANIFWRTNIDDMAFPTGKEVFLCKLTPESGAPISDFAVIELPRFTDDGEEYIHFTENTVILPQKRPLPLICRCATIQGLQRISEKFKDLTKDEVVNIIELNSDIDFEDNTYAILHRERLKNIALSEENPINCAHCGQPVTEPHSNIVESNYYGKIKVGIVHNDCLMPCDRILGTATCPIFEELPELKNFDLDGWIKASLNGHLGLPFDLPKNSMLGWGGLEPKRKLEMYMIVYQLEDGTEEIGHRRNDVERLPKKEALRHVEFINKIISTPEYQKDPFCYSEQSKTFSKKSRLLEILGGQERLIPVEKASIRKYNSTLANKYKNAGHWYAPLFYLRDIETSQIFPTDSGLLFLLSNPLNIRLFLDNWNDLELTLSEYETVSILNDNEFDNLMRWAYMERLRVIIDPIFTPGDRNLVSGWPIQAIEEVTSIPWKREAH